VTEGQSGLFNALFQNGTFFRPSLTEYILTSPFHLTPVHSAIWKFYLVISPELRSRDIASFDEWRSILESKRLQFEAIRERYPTSATGSLHNFEKETSIFRCDMDRLFQDHPFFDQRNSENLATLQTIRELLFFHLCEHPSISYLQGFHELLGVVYYLFAQEMCCERAELDDPLSTVFDARYVAADVYWVYSALLEFLLSRHCYDGANAVDAIQRRVAQVDAEVFRVLTTHRISAAVYMLSWVRVLFSRSVGLIECRPLWSVIFTFVPDFTIIEHLAIGHLLLLRDKLKRATCSSDVLRTVTQVPTVVAALSDREAAELMLGYALDRSKKPQENQTEVLAVELDEIIDKWDIESLPWVVARLKKCRDACLAIEQIGTLNCEP
jgi:hypothetical protein